MRLQAILGSALFCLFVSACGYHAVEPKEPEFQGQSYADALKVICDVDKRGAVATDDPFEASRKRTEIIQAQVENPDAIYLRTMLSVKGAAEQGAELRKEAIDAGLKECALADDLEKTGIGGLAP